MKVITVKQPWAWAIATGAKHIENRSRGTSYRGPLAIHAGKGWSQRGAQDPRMFKEFERTAYAIHGSDGKYPAAALLPLMIPQGHYRGFIIATCDLIDSHPDTGHCCRPWGESSYTEAGGRLRTVMHHLVLDDIRPVLPPLEARGALGLWNPDADLLEELTARRAA